MTLRSQAKSSSFWILLLLVFRRTNYRMTLAFCPQRLRAGHFPRSPTFPSLFHEEEERARNDVSPLDSSDARESDQVSILNILLLFAPGI